MVIHPPGYGFFGRKVRGNRKGWILIGLANRILERVRRCVVKEYPDKVELDDAIQFSREDRKKILWVTVGRNGPRDLEECFVPGRKRLFEWVGLFFMHVY
jgi:hypothetical protein